MSQLPQPPQSKAPIEANPANHHLFIVFDQTTSTLKIGTCEHCVVQEQVRPTTTWEAEGDKELDFERDKLLAGLASLGIEIKFQSQYVCP